MDKNGKPAKKKAPVQRSEPSTNEAGRPAKNINAAAAKSVPANSGKKMGKGSARGR